MLVIFTSKYGRSTEGRVWFLGLPLGSDYFAARIGVVLCSAVVLLTAEESCSVV